MDTGGHGFNLKTSGYAIILTICAGPCSLPVNALFTGIQGIFRMHVTVHKGFIVFSEKIDNRRKNRYPSSRTTPLSRHSETVLSADALFMGIQRKKRRLLPENKRDGLFHQNRAFSGIIETVRRSRFFGRYKDKKTCYYRQVCRARKKN